MSRAESSTRAQGGMPESVKDDRLIKGPPPVCGVPPFLFSIYHYMANEWTI